MSALAVALEGGDGGPVQRDVVVVPGDAERPEGDDHVRGHLDHRRVDLPRQLLGVGVLHLLVAVAEDDRRVRAVAFEHGAQLALADVGQLLPRDAEAARAQRAELAAGRGDVEDVDALAGVAGERAAAARGLVVGVREHAEDDAFLLHGSPV